LNGGENKMNLNKINLKQEHSENLKDYYRHVKTCTLCKKEYGTDRKREINSNTCPICVWNLREKNSMLEVNER